jgi:hypothetical protein
MNLREGIEDMLVELEDAQAPADDIRMHRVKWRGREFPCSISSERRSRALEPGGWVDIVEMTIYVRKSLVDPVTDASSDEPTADSDEMTADQDDSDFRATKMIELVSLNRTYRIHQVRLDPSGAFYAIDVTDPYRP